jgi:hypothetical protein
MFDEILEAVEVFASKDPKDFASFKAMVLIRNKIAAEEAVSHSMAGQIASKMTIELPVDLSDEEIEQLITPVAKLINNVIGAMIYEHFDGTSIIEAASKFELSFG